MHMDKYPDFRFILINFAITKSYHIRCISLIETIANLNCIGYLTKQDDLCFKHIFCLSLFKNHII